MAVVRRGLISALGRGAGLAGCRRLWQFHWRDGRAEVTDTGKQTSAAGGGRGGAEPLITARDATPTLEATLAVAEAAATGGEVALSV